MKQHSAKEIERTHQLLALDSNLKTLTNSKGLSDVRVRFYSGDEQGYVHSFTFKAEKSEVYERFKK